MPVQLTLRSPKGGRVLSERTYDDGYRIDAVSGWLVVVDRNGSVIAAHAACPGLEGAVVEYTTHTAAAATRSQTGEPLDEVEVPGLPHGDEPATAAAVGPDDEDGFPPELANEARDDDDRFDENLLANLRGLGNTYGPLGVALAAASLTDRRALIALLIDNRTRQPRQEPAETPAPPHVELPYPDEDGPDGYEANLDALRAEVARLTGLLDDASREADRADRAERLLAAQQRATGTLRDHLDSERARAEQAEEKLQQAEATVELYRHRYGSTLRWNLDEQERPIRAGDAPSPLPSEVLGSVDAGRGIAAFVLTPEALDRLPILSSWPVTPSTGADEPDEESDAAVEDPPCINPRCVKAAHRGPCSEELLPLDTEPRRPTLDHWPSDAVLLTYTELRRLIALHLEQVDGINARAMLDGETPLRVSEVLDR